MKLKMILVVIVLLAISCNVQSAGNCDLLKFWGGFFEGVGYIHPGFKGAIININGYAQQCRIKVVLTSSFRKDNGKKLEGAKYKPASRSNHFVGHAIDMNLRDGNLLCKWACLLNNKYHSKGVKCFTQKIMQDAGLRWGVVFKDPVHIDDAINIKKSEEYDGLYQSLQANCNFLPVSG
ncbi:uncharacterized protein LOC113681788 [Pocillopora damicornis]|nr:uncharacterized protein LOC113681788 [Pocillopora damicornis]